MAITASWPSSTPPLKASRASQAVALAASPAPPSTPAKPRPWSRPKREDEHERANARSSVVQQVLDRDVDDRERDERLHHPRRELDDAVGGQGQGDGVGEGEGGDLDEQRAEARAESRARPTTNSTWSRPSGRMCVEAEARGSAGTGGRAREPRRAPRRGRGRARPRRARASATCSRGRRGPRSQPHRREGARGEEGHLPRARRDPARRAGRRGPARSAGGPGGRGWPRSGQRHLEGRGLVVEPHAQPALQHLHEPRHERVPLGAAGMASIARGQRRRIGRRCRPPGPARRGRRSRRRGRCRPRAARSRTSVKRRLWAKAIPAGSTARMATIRHRRPGVIVVDCTSIAGRDALPSAVSMWIWMRPVAFAAARLLRGLYPRPRRRGRRSPPWATASPPATRPATPIRSGWARGAACPCTTSGRLATPPNACRTACPSCSRPAPCRRSSSSWAAPTTSAADGRPPAPSRTWTRSSGRCRAPGGSRCSSARLRPACCRSWRSGRCDTPFATTRAATAYAPWIPGTRWRTAPGPAARAPELALDGLHPNAHGQLVLAREIARGLGWSIPDEPAAAR